jgi:hypothetical protein
MKRDDFNVRIDQVRELATKYSKPELQRMVQMGVVGPQEAVMAGMMIDRIAKSAMTPPQTTVAQDVLGQAPTAEGQGMPPQMAQGQMPQGQMPPQMPPPPQMAAHGGIMGMMPHSDGLAALPSNIPDYAGGGIVAFADGGSPEDMVRASRQADAALASMPSDQGLTLPGGFKFREYAQQQPTNIRSEISALREAEREAGVDPDMYKRMREEDGASKEDFAKQKEEAKGAAALAFASKLFQARKGQEGQMLGAGIADASNIYGSALKDIRNTEKDIKKTQRELMMAEDRVKRDMSGKAKQTVDAKAAKIEDLQIRQTEQFNKAAEKASDLFVTQYGIDENAKKALEVAKTSGEYQIKVAQIHAATAGKPGETERLLGRYHDILAKQGPEAANKFMGNIGQIRNVGKPQNTLSYEEALKILSQSDPTFGMKTLEEKKRLATELIQSDPSRMSEQGTSTTANPFKLSPEAAAALKQYGGQ